MMKERKHTSYLKMDFKRLVGRKETYLGIAGVCLALFFSIGTDIADTRSVIAAFLLSTYSVGFALAFVFCVLPYGTVYIDDLETRYAKYLVSRGNLKKYVSSKTIMIFGTSVCVMALGCILFALCCASRFPWMDWGEDLSIIGYAGLVSKKMYILWIAANGIQWGIWAACLALVSAYVSLYISNKLLVLSIPVCLDQAVTEVGADFFLNHPKWDPRVIFDSRCEYLSQNAIEMVLRAVGVGVTFAVGMGIATYFKMKKRM